MIMARRVHWANLVPKPPGQIDDRNDMKKTRKSHFIFGGENKDSSGGSDGNSGGSGNSGPSGDKWQ